MSIQYKINLNKFKTWKEENAKICERVNDVYLKHALEDRVPLEMESFQFWNCGGTWCDSIFFMTDCLQSTKGSFWIHNFTAK
jgi:hypothetical protein